jgi:hypothetical protein
MQKELLKNYCSPDDIYVWYDDIFTKTVLEDTNNLIQSGNYFKNKDTDILKNEYMVILIVSLLLSKIITLIIIWKEMFTFRSKEKYHSHEETGSNFEKKLNDKTKECELIKNDLMEKNAECERIKNKLNLKSAELKEKTKEFNRIRSYFSSECGRMKKSLNEKTKGYKRIQISLIKKSKECERIRNNISLIYKPIQSSLNLKEIECDRIRNQSSSDCERMKKSLNEKSKESEQKRNENALSVLSYLNSYEGTSTSNTNENYNTVVRANLSPAIWNTAVKNPEP